MISITKMHGPMNIKKKLTDFYVVRGGGSVPIVRST